MESRFLTIKAGGPSMATPFSEVYTAGEDLAAGTIVSLALGTTAIKADAALGYYPIGFTLAAALAEAPVLVCFVGKFQPVFEVAPVEPFFTLTPLFLGTAGRVVTVPASSGLALQIGLGWTGPDGHWLSFTPNQAIILM